MAALEDINVPIVIDRWSQMLCSKCREPVAVLSPHVDVANARVVYLTQCCDDDPAFVLHEPSSPDHA